MGGELFLLHDPDVLLQDAHKRAHVVLPRTQQREGPFFTLQVHYEGEPVSTAPPRPKVQPPDLTLQSFWVCL